MKNRKRICLNVSYACHERLKEMSQISGIAISRLVEELIITSKKWIRVFKQGKKK